MKLINSYFEILPQDEGLEGVYKQIEKAGRTAYKSEDKITEGSAIKFTNRLAELGHGAALEHGTVYLTIKSSDPSFAKIVDKYSNNKYSKINEFDNIAYITTNYRVVYENNWLEDLKYLSPKESQHYERITVKFICDNGVGRELCRHRVFSFMQESTRYCNYIAKEKFGNELTFIIPTWLEETLQPMNMDETLMKLAKLEPLTKEERFIVSCIMVEGYYRDLVKTGCTAQEARQVLPLGLKTEVVMTGFKSDWEGFFKLRCDKAAHPDIRKLALQLKEKL